MNKIVVVGGGFSGLVSAISAKKDNSEVIVLEKRSIVGKKILVTGNGRCNYYNEVQENKFYHSSNEDFVSNNKDDKITKNCATFILNPNYCNAEYIEIKDKNNSYIKTALCHLHLYLLLLSQES